MSEDMVEDGSVHLQFTGSLEYPDEPTTPATPDLSAEIAEIKEWIEQHRVETAINPQTTPEYYQDFNNTLNETLTSAQAELADAALEAEEAFTKAEQAVTDASNAWDEAQAAHQKAMEVETDVITLEAKAVVGSVTEYAVSASETVPPTSGWSTATPERTPGTFIWMRTTITYGDDTTNTTSPALLTGNTGSQGSQGIPGTDGADGVSLYTWLKYADDANGTGMSDDPAGKTYMGLAYNQTSSTESTDPDDYSWSLVSGEAGIQGPPGDDGQTLYTWIQYADNASGGGMSQSPTGKTYIGIAYNQTTDVESTDPDDYQWALIQGPKGDQGDQGPRGLQGLQGEDGAQGIPGTDGEDGVSSYTHVAYANSADGTVDFSTTNSNREYIGIHVGPDPADPVTPGVYNWTLIKGADGTQGIPGTPGDDGLTAYLHIAYANSSNGVTGFSTTESAGKLYIGQYTDHTAADSTTPGDYSWTLIKGDKGDQGDQGPRGLQGIQGDKGDQGIPGTPGDDGVSSYTHVAYATNSTGTTGFSTTDPVGKTYIGIHVGPQVADPTTPGSYNWSLIKGADGAQGIPGTPGEDGLTAYLHIAYSTSPTGSTGFSTTDSTGKTYIGQYTDHTAADSTNPSLYSWTLIKGADGDKGDKGDKGDTGNTGSTGVSVTKITPFYQQRTLAQGNPSQPANTWTPNPPTGWVATEPAYVPNTKLFRLERVEYSNSTAQYTAWTDVSSYALASAAKGEIDNLVNVTLPDLNDELDDRFGPVEDAVTDLNNRDSNHGYKYSYDIIVYGDSDKAYPVVWWGGDQNVKRDILIKRAYSEQAPPDWNTSTHKGGLTVKLKANFGGWGGANYSWEVHELEQMYAPTFGGALNVCSNMGFAVMLRGGGTTGAIYHMYSDQPFDQVRGTELGPGPIPYYNSDLLHYYPPGHANYDNPVYTWAMPDPRPFPLASTWAEQIRVRKFIDLAQATDSLTGSWTTTGTTTIDGGKITADSIRAAQIAADTITANEIASDAIYARHVKAGEITANEMKTGTITASSGIIDNLAIQTAHIANGAVTNLKVSDLNVGKLTGDAADFTTLFTEDLLTNNAFIDNLAATRLVVGASPNLLKMGNVLSSSDLAAGGWDVQQVGTNSAVFGWTTLHGGVLQTTIVGPAIVGNPFEMKRGEKYTFSASARIANTNRSLRVEAVGVERNSSGAWETNGASFDLFPMQEISTTYSPISGTGTALATGTYMLRFSFNSPTQYALYINDMRVTSQLKGVVIENGTITAEKLNVTSAWIGDLLTSSIVTGKLVGETITGTTITGSTITGNTISGGTINSVTLNSATINGTVTNSGTINGGQITGSTIQTSTSGRRIELSPAGTLKFWDDSLTVPRMTIYDDAIAADYEFVILADVGSGGSGPHTRFGAYGNSTDVKFPGGVGSGSLSLSATGTVLTARDIDLNATALFSFYRNGSEVFSSNSSTGTTLSYSSSSYRATSTRLDMHRDGNAVLAATSSATVLYSGGSGTGNISLAAGFTVGSGFSSFDINSSTNSRIQSNASGDTTISGSAIYFTNIGPSTSTNRWAMEPATAGGTSRNMLRFLGGSAYMASTGLAANLHMDGNGRIYFSSSSAANKLDVQDVGTDPTRILDVAVRDWYDKTEAEGYARYLDGDEDEMISSTPLRRIPGVVAEELEKLGLGQFLTYGLDGKPNGVLYDRLTLLLIPIVRELLKRFESLESLVQTLTPKEDG